MPAVRSRIYTVFPWLLGPNTTKLYKVWVNHITEKHEIINNILLRTFIFFARDFIFMIIKHIFCWFPSNIWIFLFCFQMFCNSWAMTLALLSYDMFIYFISVFLFFIIQPKLNCITLEKWEWDAWITTNRILYHLILNNNSLLFNLCTLFLFSDT